MANRIIPKNEQILEATTKRAHEGKEVIVPIVEDDAVRTLPNSQTLEGAHVIKKELVNVEGVEKYLEQIHERAKKSGVKNAETALVHDLWASFVHNGWIIPSKLTTPYIPNSNGILIPAGGDAIVKSLFEQNLELPSSEIVRVNKLSLESSKNMQFDPDYTVSGLPYLFHFSRNLSAPKAKIGATGYAVMGFRKVQQESFDRFFQGQFEQIMDGPYSTADKLGKRAQLRNVQGILQNLNKTLITNPAEYCLSLGVMFSTLADLYNIGFEIADKAMPKDLSKLTICISDPNAIITSQTNQKTQCTRIEITSETGTLKEREGIRISKEHKGPVKK